MLARVRTPSAPVRERERERGREKKKEGEREKERKREREKERKREKEKERKREREKERVIFILFLKGMMGALAPFGYLVLNIFQLIASSKNK
jgi:hypothetical protein